MSRRGTPLIEGRAIGQKIGAGRVRKAVGGHHARACARGGVGGGYD